MAFPPFFFQKPEFILGVSMYQAKGFSRLDKFGINQNLTPATAPEDIWEYGGMYNYDTFGTAPIMYLSSSNAADTQPIKITGLDIDGNEITQQVTLTGQIVALLPTPLWRVYRLENEANTGGNLAGTVYCHTSPTVTAGVPPAISVRATIFDGNNQTLMALYTVPKGNVGFLFRGEVGIELEGNLANLAEFAHIHYESRRLGKVFKVKKALSLIVGGSSIYQDNRSFPDIIPSLTDIKLKVQSVSANMGTWGTFDILLVDETFFEPGFLQQIGQPGY